MKSKVSKGIPSYCSMPKILSFRGIENKHDCRDERLYEIVQFVIFSL